MPHLFFKMAIRHVGRANRHHIRTRVHGIVLVLITHVTVASKGQVQVLAQIVSHI